MQTPGSEVGGVVLFKVILSNNKALAGLLVEINGAVKVALDVGCRSGRRHQEQIGIEEFKGHD